MKIAIVTSRFNQKITLRLLNGAIKRLVELGVNENEINTTWVPGAIELPLIAQQWAKQSDVDAVICLGCVIQGETDHYDYVCQQVSYGCQRVSLTHNKPIIFGILTTQNSKQALARAGGEHSHKGHEAADTAVEMIKTLKELGKN